jgi:glycosyltransferase involved in cell wall biosynthesis
MQLKPTSKQTMLFVAACCAFIISYSRFNLQTVRLLAAHKDGGGGGSGANNVGGTHQLIALQPDLNHQCYCKNAPKEGCGFLEPLSTLVNQPEYAPGQLPPCLLYFKKLFFPTDPPKFSMIVTVHNQDDLIRGNIQALLEKTTEPWELVVVFNAASETSISEVVAALQESGCIDPGKERIDVDFLIAELEPSQRCSNSDLVGIQLIKQPTSVFETTANNIGMRAASGEYYIIIQEDMRIEELGWNSILAAPARQFEDVLGISARCAHGFDQSKRIGIDCGDVQDKINRCEFHVRDTANRGPLLLRSAYVKQLGYFDEQNFFFANDDHDIFSRGWFQHHWVTGWYYINFTHYGHQNVGGKKKPPRTAEEVAFYEFRAARSADFKRPQAKLKSSTHNEIRQMNLSSCTH